MIFLTVDQVINIHARLIKEHGGLDGIREMGLLISAVEMAKSTMFGEYLHPSIFDKAAAYLFHIVGNHPFLDGNKRTGTACALIFLLDNNIQLDFDPAELEELVVNVAQGKVSKHDISLFFQSSQVEPF